MMTYVRQIDTFSQPQKPQQAPRANASSSSQHMRHTRCLPSSNVVQHAAFYPSKESNTQQDLIDKPYFFQ
jgi:hypothetical protein